MKKLSKIALKIALKYKLAYYKEYHDPLYKSLTDELSEQDFYELYEKYKSEENLGFRKELAKELVECIYKNKLPTTYVKEIKSTENDREFNKYCTQVEYLYLDKSQKLELASLQKPLKSDVIELLVNDEDYEVRAEVAKRSDLPLKFIEQLSDDQSPSVRIRISNRPSLPTKIVHKLKEDPSEYIRNVIQTKNVSLLSPKVPKFKTYDISQELE